MRTAWRPSTGTIGPRRSSIERTQLCLTNPELRQAFLEKLLPSIETSWSEAQAAGLPPPLAFSVSQNDNVIIRLCDTEADPTQPITSPENAALGEYLLSWARIAKNLRIWDYVVTYAKPVGLPRAQT